MQLVIRMRREPTKPPQRLGGKVPDLQSSRKTEQLAKSESKMPEEADNIRSASDS